MRKLFILLIALILSGNVYALTDEWGVDMQQHPSVQRTYKQGESHELRVSLRNGLKPLDLTGATALFLWYTNTVQNIWWTNSVAITAPLAGIVQTTWTPAMDVGASSYAYWIGIWPAGSTSPLWRVTGTIRMLPSPGFQPNALVPPVRTLDFAAMTLTNAPWVTAADWSSGSNALASALQAEASDRSAAFESNAQAIAAHELRVDNPHAITAEQIGAATPAAVTGIVDAAIAAIPPASTDAHRLINVDATKWIDGTGGVWSVTTTSVTTLTHYAWSMIDISAFGALPPVPSLNLTPDMLPDFQLGPFWTLHLDEANIGQWDSVTLYFDSGGGDTGLWSTLPSGWQGWPATLLPDLSGNCFGQATVTPVYSVSVTVSTNPVDRVRFASEGTVVFFTDVPLYASGGTNYYWRFDSALGTYVITGVPQ